MKKRRYDLNEILEYENRGDCYIWCYPIDLEEFNTQNIWAHNSTVPKPSEKTTVYIHVPYCKFICSMCPFTHEPLKGQELDDYVNALLKEITAYSKHDCAKTTNVTSVYFGGGTASLLTPVHIDKILTCLSQHYKLDEMCEITIECHPNTVDEKYLRAIHSKGIKRVSFGVQSFQQKNIDSLKLFQKGERNQFILEEAMSVGFKSVACDIMYNFPDQDIVNLNQDLEKAIDIGVHGLSTYALDPEVRKLRSVKEIQQRMKMETDMFYHINQVLTGNNFLHIAQPDYSKPGHENKQILDLWGAPQANNLSFGAGSFTESFNGYTWANIHNPKEYIQCIENNKMPILLGKKWDINDAMSRYMVLGTRCLKIPLQNFEEQFGISLLQVFKYEIKQLENLGYIELTNTHLNISKKGMFYIDNISKTFFTFSNRGLAQFWGCHMRNDMPEKFVPFLEGSHDE